MLRLVLLFLALLILATGVLALLGVLRWIDGPVPKSEEDTLPNTVRKIAHIVLVILLFGVTAGFLGAA